MIGFITDEGGAVTVDWIVLTAATVGLGTTVTTTIGKGVKSLTELIAADLAGSTISAPLNVGVGNEPLAVTEPYSYSPQDAKAWDSLLADIRVKLAKTTAAEFIDIMSGYANNDGSIKSGTEDEYAAIQTVYEENGYSLPQGVPDMRNF